MLSDLCNSLAVARIIFRGILAVPSFCCRLCIIFLHLLCQFILSHWYEKNFSRLITALLSHPSLRFLAPFNRLAGLAKHRGFRSCWLPWRTPARGGSQANEIERLRKRVSFLELQRQSVDGDRPKQKKLLNSISTTLQNGLLDMDAKLDELAEWE